MTEQTCTCPYSPYDPAHYAHDPANFPVLRTISLLRQQGEKIVFLSGREDIGTNRAVTSQALARLGFVQEPLIMRKKGDQRNDGVIKQELFNEFVAPHYNVRLVLDDRTLVVKAWRSRGIPCWQVAPGDF